MNPHEVHIHSSLVAVSLIAARKTRGHALRRWPTAAVRSLGEGRPAAPGEELNDGEVSDARQAATLVLLRDAAEGPEVLLVQRNPRQRFMGGAWVFPGGAVHAEDADHAAAAVRELREEAGVELPPDAPVVPWSRWITPGRGQDPLRHLVLRGRGAGRALSRSPTAASASTRAGCGRRWRSRSTRATS